MNHLGDLLSAHLDGELDPAERRRADAHLAGCEPCRTELAGVDAARGSVRALPVLDAPSGLTSARSRRRWIPSPAWATALAVALALAVGLVVGPGEPGVTFQVDTLRDQHTARVVGDPGIATFRGDLP
jgi:anti-sigma factor RsiW